MTHSNKNRSLELNADSLDELLGSSGYLLPSNELELLRFEKLYEDYQYKLADKKIDVHAIMNGTYRRASRQVKVVDLINQDEVGELRMVARNGETKIPDDILKKMRDKHSKKDDGKK